MWIHIICSHDMDPVHPSIESLISIITIMLIHDHCSWLSHCCDVIAFQSRRGEDKKCLFYIKKRKLLYRMRAVTGTRTPSCYETDLSDHSLLTLKMIIQENPCRSACLAPTTTPSSKSPFFPFWGSTWTSAGHFDYVCMPKCFKLHILPCD